MPRHKMKLELNNDRSIKAADRGRVFDSIEDQRVINALRHEPIQSLKGSGPFLAASPSKAAEVDIRALRDPIITNKGDYFELQMHVVKRPTSVNYDSTRVENDWDVHRNPIKKTYKAALTRPRVRTPMMDKICDRGGILHAPNILDDIESGKVQGAKWPDTERPLGTPMSEAANTQYDTQRWFEGKYATKPPDVIFSTANLKPRYGTGPKEEKDRPMTREECEEEARRYEARSPSKSARVTKFDDIERFKPVFKEESFRKGGIPLPADYDAKDAWGKPVQFSVAPRYPKEFPSPTSEIQRSYNIDTGPKASTAVQVQQSPLTYRAAFSGKGTYFDPALVSSGVPAKYANAFPPAIEIREPHKQSLMFMRDNYEWPRNPGPDPLFKTYRFGQDAPFFHFPQAGGRPPSWIRAENIKKMISTMHPRLAREQYPAVKKRSYQPRKLIK